MGVILEDHCQQVKKTEALSPISFQPIPTLLLLDLTKTTIREGKTEPVLERGDIAIFALLKAHSRNKPVCWPSYKCLAKEANCSVSTIQRSLERLENAGHVTLKNRNGKTAKIFILTDVGSKGVISKGIQGENEPKQPHTVSPAPVQATQPNTESPSVNNITMDETKECLPTFYESETEVTDDPSEEPNEDDEPLF